MLHKKKWIKSYKSSVKNAHLASDYADMPFAWFAEQVWLFTSDGESEIDFDESFYLLKNPDVKLAIEQNKFGNGFLHFCIHGKQEGRLWRKASVTSSTKLSKNNHLKSKNAWLKRFDETLKQAHQCSDYSEKPIDWFENEVWHLYEGSENAIDFDEQFYLEANNDVEDAVAMGQACCGYVHYCLHGRAEHRPWSTKYLEQNYAIQPKYPKGLISPILSGGLPKYGPDLSQLPLSDNKQLVIFIPYLQQQFFFAGYSGFFKDLSQLFEQFDSTKVIVTNQDLDTSLLTNLYPSIDIITLDSVDQVTTKPNLIYCFDTETFFQAKEIFKSLEHTVYYCQDYEAGFHPYGSMYARSQQAIYESKNIVFSTLMLENFISNRKLLSNNCNVYVTSPTIEPVDVDSTKHKRLFLYFRPEKFNSRNMPEHISAMLDTFTKQHQDYEIFMVGSVASNYSYRLNGSNIIVVSKLPKDKYHELLSTSDVVVALIYSAHPGVIAFQAAASGIPTVTNIFENRDQDFLTSISENIVSFDPVREELYQKVLEALAKPKGKPSFNSVIYSGSSGESFVDYNKKIMNAG